MQLLAWACAGIVSGLILVGAGIVTETPSLTKVALYGTAVNFVMGVFAVVAARLRGEWE